LRSPFHSEPEALHFVLLLAAVVVPGSDRGRTRPDVAHRHAPRARPGRARAAQSAVCKGQAAPPRSGAQERSRARRASGGAPHPLRRERHAERGGVSSARSRR
jgi:hypothetical protein